MKRRLLAIVSLVTFVVGLGVAWWATDFAARELRVGRTALAEGRPAEAIARWSRVTPPQPLAPAASLNRAVAQFQSGDIAGAEAALRQVLPSLPSDDLRALAYYDLGTILAHQERWPESLALLRESLRRRNLPAAQANYVWVLDRLPPPPPRSPPPSPPPPTDDAQQRARDADAGFSGIPRRLPPDARPALDR